MDKPLTKNELFSAISEDTGLTKKQIAEVFDSLNANINNSLANDACGKFVLPGLLKIEKKEVPAKPAKTGVPNPFKPGETMDIPAKPASTKVILRALKGLKEMI